MKFISTSLAGPAPLALVVAFDVYVVSSMVLALASALTRRDREGGRWLALEGIAGAIGGPGQTTVALIVLFGAWALVNRNFEKLF